jgi:hypothetical protein
MQSAKLYWAVFVVFCVGVTVTFAGQPLPSPQNAKAAEVPGFFEFLPAPEFVPVNYLRTADIPKMTIEKALALTKRHASYFLAPIDAAILQGRMSCLILLAFRLIPM